jgi:hypothetical protein
MGKQMRADGLLVWLDCWQQLGGPPLPSGTDKKIYLSSLISNGYTYAQITIEIIQLEVE